MNIVEIKISQLKIHPNNIRKEYEGIDELAHSIKENGIMQNLTVVPDKEDPGTYFVVIGNRRLTAAKQAGIESAPCIIVDDMSDKDQITTMLTENMNRKDLKFYEEAAAVQMCMKDFGFNIEEMEKKTGLSKTTLHHRLNLAKLDQKTLQKRANDANFQLTLNDLYALEKIENVAVRNKILKEAFNSRDLLNKARSAENDQIREKNTKVLIEMCKKRGIQAAPKNTENEMYSGKWDQVVSYNLLEEPPKQIRAKQGELFYCVRYGTFYILEKKVVSKEKKQLTPYEIEAKLREQHRKAIGTKYKSMFADMGDFVRNIFAGKIPMVENTELLEQMVWKAILADECWISQKDIVATLMGKDYWSNSVEPEERKAAQTRAITLPIIFQKIAVAYWKLQKLDLMSYNGEPKDTALGQLKGFYRILELFGYSWDDEESEQIMNGTHEYYVKHESKGEECEDDD